MGGLKKRKTKNYFVIGTAHLGMHDQELEILAKVSKLFKCTPVHVGPLATLDEIIMYRERIRKIRVWDNMRKLTQKQEDAYDNALAETSDLIQLQMARIAHLEGKFGKGMLFVCNDELCIPSADLKKYLGSRYKDEFFQISKHLRITAVPANGDKVSGAPITPRTQRMLHESRCSHIIPHMTPSLKTFSKPGINQAYIIVTTGALQKCSAPKRISEAYKSVSEPGGIMVSVDVDNGEFHHQRIKIRYAFDDKKRKMIPATAVDGVAIVCGSTKPIELSVDDKGLHYTDAHARHTHFGCVGALRSINALHKPSVVVDGGDSGDYESVSRHTESIPGARENLRLVNDLNNIRMLLDSVGDEDEFPWIKDRIMLDSNHAEWLSMFIAKNPSLIGLLDWQTVSKTFFPDWNVFLRVDGVDKTYKFGDLHIKHGDGEIGVMQPNQIYGNYLSGHTHTREEFGSAERAGPICYLGPKYLGNKATGWQHSVTTLSKYRGKTFKNVKIILHSEDKERSRFCYRGQIYECDFFNINWLEE